MKKILMLATGGTISCSGLENLSPAYTGEELLKRSRLDHCCSVKTVDLFSLDSTDIEPSHWLELARRIHEAEDFDGFVITHGTDTLAYTSAMLSFLCVGIQKPVVITGSQRTFDEPESDAPINLRNAFSVACSDLKGVVVVFGRKVFSGVKVHKTDTRMFDAFTSANGTEIGTITDEAVCISKEILTSELVKLPERLEAEIAVISLVPGTSAKVLNSLVDAGVRGIILRVFGAGGLPSYGGWPKSVSEAVKKGIVFLVVSQCESGQVELERYRVGTAAIEAGAISAGNMTLESAYAKLLWGLSLSNNPEKIRQMLRIDFCGEYAE